MSFIVIAMLLLCVAYILAQYNGAQDAFACSSESSLWQLGTHHYMNNQRMLHGLDSDQQVDTPCNFLGWTAGTAGYCAISKRVDTWNNMHIMPTGIHVERQKSMSPFFAYTLYLFT